MTALEVPRAGIEYLAHQEAGIRWMMAREAEDAPVCRGGILADDMGLGKTFQMIGLMKNSPLALRTLIVCPPAVISAWTDELRACGYGVSVIAQGAASWTLPSAFPASSSEATVWLTTYPKMSMKIYSRFLASSAFGRIVLDEGHIIRNGKATSRWMSAMAVGAAPSVKSRWILSATPVQNGFNDWKNLCMWLGIDGGGGVDVAEIGPTIMLRRTMAELRDAIAALPPPPRYVSHDLSIPEGTKEGKLFRALCDQLSGAIDSKTVSALIKLELYMRIQQFLVHPQVYIDSMRAKFKTAYPRPDWSTGSAGGGSAGGEGGATKWTAVMTELALSVEQKVGTIVFCNFRAEMDRVEAAAAAMGASVFSIRGGMGTDKVGESVSGASDAVRNGQSVVVVVQIVSGGAGLNLQFCRRILFMSQHWNPAVVHQAVGRAVRIGQRAVVDVHMFSVVDDVMDNLDRRMINIHLRKIAGAQEICESLYEGYAPLQEIPSQRFDSESDSEAEEAEEAEAEA